MRKFISKIAGLMLGLSLVAGLGTVAIKNHHALETKADLVTFTVGTDSGSTSLSKNGVSVTTTSGTFSRTDNYRVYANNSMTVSVSTGNITEMSFTISQNTFTADVGTWSENSWTGSSDSVTLSASGGQVRFTTFSVTFSTGGDVSTYTITYDSNGGTGTMADTTGSVPSVADCTFTPPEGKIFSKWNTAANGSGVDYTAGQTVSEDVDLFAIWVDKPICVTLEDIGASLGSTANTEEATVDILDGSDAYTLNYYQCKKQGNAMFMTKDVNPYISNSTEMPGVITSIEVFTNSGSSGKVSYDVAFGTSEYHEATSGVGAVVIGVGTSHVFENASVEGATYFCITLGNSNNGQVLKIVVNYEEGEAPDPTKKDMVIYTSGNPAAGGSFYYSKNAGTYVFSAYENSDLVSGVTWSVSDETVATINSSTGAVTTLTPGDVTIYAEADGYNKASAAVHFIKGALEELDITGSMTKTAYFVGEAWNPSGFTVTGTYHSGWEEDVTSKVSWSYNPASPAVSVVSVTVTATLDEISDTSSAQTVSVTKTNPLRAIYSMSENDSVDVYGVFVGNKDGNNIIIMDGEYGMDVYKYGCGTNSYVEGETILHVVGKVAIFNGLYEISGSPTITEVSSADVETPVTYSSHGSETAEYASRVTTVTGVPSVTKGDLTADPAAADITLSFSVAGTPVQVFYKKATQTREDMDTIKAAVDGSKEMTVKGFTAWYNGFQVQMTGLVEAVESYTAEDFSQDLLDQTDAVCTGFKDGDNNHDALVLIWNDLASADKYPSLPSAQKTILAEAERNESGTVVEQAMARYDYLTGKYNLNNFINGRTPVVVAGSQLISTANMNNNSSTIVIVVVALTSITSIGVLLVIKRKRSLVK